ncbi:DUF1048 domain-containing protein [Clostridium butyricum]|uniref:DUF1048 domain-containing protein n=1 Tax=Clostridium butyricum TaxID=1492 RepID=UPI000F5452EF|nr:DUF1048 domain-containing protein [Clostridium butyricum]RQN10999.1 DUF1048 domain-containing protein [Clostridium butyricum]
MNFWDKITGNDITKEIKSFEFRVKKLPNDYQVEWEKIKSNIWEESDFSGRNIIPILEGVLSFLEERAADGLSVDVVLGEDMKEFCSELAFEYNGKSFRDKWRKQLNSNISKKLGK